MYLLVLVLTLVSLLPTVLLADALFVTQMPPPAPPALSWVGVPTPDFGATIGNPITYPTPDVPDPWTSDTPGFYYIERSDTDCDDSGNGHPGGGPGAARCTIPTTLSAGDVVRVAGTYYKTSISFLTINGTSDQPVFIGGAPGGPKPTMGNEIYFRGDYFFVENMHWAGDVYPSLRPGIWFAAGTGANTTYGTARNLSFQGNLTFRGGITTSGSLGDETSNIVLYDIDVRDNGDFLATGDVDAHCFTVGTYTSNFWLLESYAYRCAGDGIQVNGGADKRPFTHHIYIAGNTFETPGQSGAWAKESTDVIMSENLVFNAISQPNRPDGYGDGLGGQYNPVRLWIINNIVYDVVDNGIVIKANNTGATGYVYFIGNLVYDAGVDCISFWNTSPIEGAAVNNTADDCGRYGVRSAQGGTTAVLTLENNLIGDTADANISISGSASTTDYEGHIGTAEYDWSGASGISLATLRSSYSQGLNSAEGYIATDTWQDKATRNYQLKSGSPAIDNGKVPDIYAEFETRYGLDIRQDILGTTRPKQGGWDQGAFEFAP